MKVSVIIPIGPGHEGCAVEAVQSVERAWGKDHGPFGECEIVQVPDPGGGLGRSAARNRGLDERPADWHFLLDADDWMLPRAFGLVDLSVAATFGAVCLGRKVIKDNCWPVTREILLERGAAGTLSMGCFVRGDLGLRFDVTLDVGEDFDFYLRLPSFTKQRDPLVGIGRGSAGGPRSSRGCRWREACAAVVERYRAVKCGLMIHTLPRPPGLVVGETVLDLGAGLRPMQWYRARRHICVEPHGPYATLLRGGGYEVRLETADQCLRTLSAAGQTVDAIYLLDVLEHMERDEGGRVLALARAVARCQVVVYTPQGFMAQEHDVWAKGGEHWQTHRSGWTPGDFTGWEISIPRLFDSNGHVVTEGFFALWNRPAVAGAVANTHS